ncbi:MAG: hypothetical protein A2Z16_14165 [Chloroflexi bacterium RBG_16_54_18]|nr:MAG: hypothetical protein A2Z16_14165 [Chloroflexi bacterium RBG_16_54_18]
MNIVCRPAQPEDTPDVLELTKTIWEGHDYVPEVWDEWLADNQGQLLVAELDGKVLGISKLSRLSPEDWWMQGLRVHPQYEGQGIASQLTDATLQAWLEIGSGTVRLGTASFRLPVQHICSRLGFTKVSELAPFYAPANQSNSSRSEFQLLAVHEVERAIEFAWLSTSLALTAGLIDLDWHYASPRTEFLAAAVERKLAWWWHGREGLLTARLDEDDELGRAPSIELLGCPLEALPQFLLDYRTLAGELGYSRAAWMAPLHESLLPTLKAAGFKRVWENSLYIYAKTHPEKPPDSTD